MAGPKQAQVTSPEKYKEDMKKREDETMVKQLVGTMESVAKVFSDAPKNASMQFKIGEGLDKNLVNKAFIEFCKKHPEYDLKLVLQSTIKIESMSVTPGGTRQYKEGEGAFGFSWKPTASTVGETYLEFSWAEKGGKKDGGIIPKKN